MIGWARVIADVAVVLLVAGCSGGDGDPPSAGSNDSASPSAMAGSASPTSAKPSLSPAPTPSPAGEPPPEPRDGMHEYSQAGVDAFTRYVIDVINYSYRTNDIEALQTISTDNCQACTSTIEQLTTIGEAGGRIEGGQLEPTNNVFDIIGPAEGFETSAGVQLVVTASQTLDSSGDIRNTEVDRDRYYIFDLEREGDAWKLAEVRNATGQ